MASRFQDTVCSPVVSNSYDTCGTLTRSSIAHLTPATLEALFNPGGLPADMTAWFKTAFEMKACGIKTNGLYDWLMSSKKEFGSVAVGFEKIDRGPSLLHPFVLAKQNTVINKDFWAIVGGSANSAYTGDLTDTAIGTTTAGPLTAAQKALGAAGDRVIRVVTRYGFDLDPAWFVTKDRVTVLGRSGGQGEMGSWKVLASAVNDDLSYIDVLVVSENAGSTTPYSATPTAGLLLAGANNVNDFESWCVNRPTLDPRKNVPFWYQTMRRTRCVDSEYRKIFARLSESNEYFAQFGDLPLAERNRQDEEEFQKRWVNTFFFGKKISANQTLANYQSLDQIQTVTGANIDVGLGGRTIAYRANMEGVYEQLQRCARVKDLQNNPLNLYEFFDELYRVVRSRKSQGKVANSIDVYTDSEYAALFETAMVNYYKQEYGDIVRMNVDVTEGANEPLGFAWRSYKVKYPYGVRINIITHEFFDDIASAMNDEGIGSRGTFLLVLDMGKPSGTKGGTIYPGMIASNRKNRTMGELEQMARVDATFACVMEHITQEYVLTSETVTAVVECPSNSLWIENIQRVPPTTTGKSGNYGDLYP